MLGWLFVAVLGIIWTVFFWPYLRRGASPVNSVEAFERKMEFLAETNGGTRGRWVLTPRKEVRFQRPRERDRTRVVRRRRRIVAGLAEAAALALLIGLFPMFHGMLLAAAVLGGVLLVYAALLVRVRMHEDRRARVRRAAARARSRQRPPIPAPARPAPASSVPAESVAANRHAVEYGFDGYGAGWNGYPTGRVAAGPADQLGPDDEIRVVIDEDVHLVVRRSQDVTLGELDAASR